MRVSGIGLAVASIGFEACGAEVKLNHGGSFDFEGGEWARGSLGTAAVIMSDFICVSGRPGLAVRVSGIGLAVTSFGFGTSRNHENATAINQCGYSSPLDLGCY